MVTAKSRGGSRARRGDGRRRLVRREFGTGVLRDEGTVQHQEAVLLESLCKDDIKKTFKARQNKTPYKLVKLKIELSINKRIFCFKSESMTNENFLKSIN